VYQFVKAICLSRSIGSQWQEIDISNELVYLIFRNYAKIYLELFNTFMDENQNVDMDILRAQYSSYNGTLLQLLTEIGNTTLDAVPELPNTDVKHARYSDAYRSMYKIYPAQIGMILDENYPQESLPDLEIKRPNYPTDLGLLHTHCLMSVNGYYHSTDSDGTRTFIKDGAITMRKGNMNHVGILSFLDVGEVSKINIDPANIFPENNTQLLKNKVHFTVPNDLSNKSFFLVLGGYLVFPQEEVFWQVSDNEFVLDLNRLPYVERIYESGLYLDLSHLQLTDVAYTTDGINIDEVWSDRVIRNYMTLSQSFLVLVDIPHLTTNKIELRHSNLPGTFTSYQDPTYPLIVNYGKSAEYWKVKEGDRWAVTVVDSFMRNYILSRQPMSTLVNVTGNLVSFSPFEFSRGFLLEITGYTT
jgi:hypothetical protein